MSLRSAGPHAKRRPRSRESRCAQRAVRGTPQTRHVFLLTSDKKGVFLLSMSSFSTRGHVFSTRIHVLPLNRRICFPVQQEDRCSCSTRRHVFLLTRRHVFLFRKKACFLVQREDMCSLQQEDTHSCSTRNCHLVEHKNMSSG